MTRHGREVAVVIDIADYRHLRGEEVGSAEIYLSALTIGEIRIGIERLRRKDADQANALDQCLTGLRTIYADRIVGVDARIAGE